MSAQTPTFAVAADHHELEEGTRLTPRFDAAGAGDLHRPGLRDGEILMLAHMKREALALTMATGEAHYYSRSRKSLWKKGESSGQTQKVSEIRIDCDQDAVLLKVAMGGTGAACHTGRRSCFYRTVPLGAAPSEATALAFTGDEPRFDPKAVYGKTHEH